MGPRLIAAILFIGFLVVATGMSRWEYPFGL
jgi:hypothetical protein